VNNDSRSESGRQSTLNRWQSIECCSWGVESLSDARPNPFRWYAKCFARPYHGRSLFARPFCVLERPFLCLLDAKNQRRVCRARSEAAMVLIQLLLPTTGRTSADGLAPLAQTRHELADRFSGLTAYLRSPAKGSWTTPDGHTEQDDVVMVEIVTETFDRAWWRTYADTLAARFDQDSIHVRAVPVDVLDEESL